MDGKKEEKVKYFCCFRNILSMLRYMRNKKLGQLYEKKNNMVMRECNRMLASPRFMEKLYLGIISFIVLIPKYFL